MTPNVLIWLPSPLGDAVMATPALRSFRKIYQNANLFFLAEPTVREFLQPCPFCDDWLEFTGRYAAIAGKLREKKFSQAVLLKNSFGSALTVFIARIPQRIGYARDGRSMLLTDKIWPAKNDKGDFLPGSTLDYYLGIADYLAGDTSDRTLYLGLTQSDRDELAGKFPQTQNLTGPLIVLVPGGAFGPSKLWPVRRFAALADKLIETFNATVVISVAPTGAEKAAAEKIRSEAKHPLLSLSDRPLKPGAIKALFEKTALVITNDTGPRHIAAALGTNVITLFGPNNPAWTKTDYPTEVQIIGKAPCVPCDKPACKQNRHLCMESIDTEQVFAEAQKFLKDFPR